MRNKIIEEALTWDGTPYHHQACVKGIGVDCAQFMAGIAKSLNLIPANAKLPTDYSPQWHLHNREEKLVEQLLAFGCVQIDIADTKPGDIIGFKIGRAVGHLGLMLNNNQFIHSQNLIVPCRVTINSYCDPWKSRHTVSFKFPGVD